MLNDDCIDVVFGFIDSGQFYKNVTLVCEQFYRVSQRRRLEILDKYCDQEMMVWLRLKPHNTSLELQARLPAKYLAMIRKSDIIPDAVSANPDTPLNMLSGLFLTDWHKVAQFNRHITPEFVRVKCPKLCDYAAMKRFPWFTKKFIKEVGSESVWNAHDYTFDDFMVNNTGQYFGLPLDVVFNIIRDPMMVCGINWKIYTVFETSVYFPLEMRRSLMNHVNYELVSMHPGLTWQFVADNMDLSWDLETLMDNIKGPIPESILDEFADCIECKPKIYWSEWKHFALKPKKVSDNIDIDIVCKEPRLAWDWEVLSSRKIKYRKIKDHLHLPWVWKTLSEFIIISATEYFSDAKVRDLIDIDIYRTNRYANYSICSS